MNKLLNNALLLLMLVAVAVGLASCGPAENTPDSDDTPIAQDDAIYSPSTDTVLVLGSGVSEREVAGISSTYYQRTGKEIPVALVSSLQAPHEIIVGETLRDASKKAYRMLALMNYNDDEVGYVIYSDGSSVAIAFDEAKFGVEAAFTAATEKFISDFMQGSTLKLDEGVVSSGFFNAIDWQADRDIETENTLWEMKSSQLLTRLSGNKALTEDILSDLKDLREMYNNEEIVKWLANLYDPETGGFYYSNSARNNVGYLPDLESTSQALGIINLMLNGYSGSITDFFGKEISDSFVKFAKSMQSSDNGYFYHPQWDRTLVDKNLSRRTRDLLNAVSILESFNASPTYDTPNGIKGDGLSVIGAASRLTSPLSQSRVAAVSSIAEPDDEVYIPAHMASKEDFENYLNSLKIQENTYDVCQELLSYTSLIHVIDEMNAESGESYRLAKICSDWLERYQNRITGLWNQTSNVTYEDVNNLYSIIKLYDGLKKVVPNSKNIAASLTDCMRFTAKIADITDISNTWSTLSVFKSNLALYGTDNDIPETRAAMNIVYSAFPTIVNATQEKLSLFSNVDGSFSTIEEGSTGMSNGMPVSIVSTDEGDINATLAATKITWLSIFNVLGVSSIPMFNTSDRMTFQKTLYEMGVIIKNEIVESDPISFEDEEIGETVKSAVVTQDTTSSATIVATDEDHGNALNIKSSYNSWEYVDFSLQQTTTGATCDIFELDMCVLPDTSVGYFAQLTLFKEMYMIGLNRVGDTVRFYEESSITASYSFSHDLGISAKVGEWFNIRVEYYVGTRETVRIKIFFNGDCIAVTDNFFGTRKLTDLTMEPGSNYTKFRIAKTPRDLTMDVLVDNVISEQNYKLYTPEESVGGALKRNVDAPESNQIVYNFENVANGSLPGGFVLSGASTVGVGADAETGNKYLSFGSGGAKLTLPLHHRGSASNSADLSFILSVDESSAVGAKYEISFDEFMYQNRSLIALHFIVAEEQGTKYLTLAEGLAGQTGNEYSHIKLPLGEKLNFRLRFFFNEGALLVFVNNELLGVNSSALGGQPRFYMGAVTMTNLTPDIPSALNLDNLICERVRGNFAEESAPDIDRVTHTFNTLDGLDASGVEVSGGALSFEMAQIGGYVKIPVNARTSAPTIYYVSLDVTKTDLSGGDIILSMTDKDGKIIASFALSSVDKGIAIYEYTENGKYKTPISSVSGSSMNLVIEYSPVKESFNIYNGDLYLTSTSVTHSINSCGYSFEYLTVKATAQAGFVIDNLVAETVSAIFKSHTPVTENKDNSSGVMTYETSSLVSIPTFFNKEFTQGTSMLRVKEGKLKSGVSRVLEFYSTKGGSDALIMKQTKTASQANAIAFESDMMLCTAGEKVELSVTLRTASTNNSVVMVYLRVNPGEYMQVLSSRGEYSVETNVKDGQWFKLRYEYAKTEYDYNYDGVYEDIIVRVYINDVLVATGDQTVNDVAYDELNINNVRFIIGKGIQGKAYFDNSKLEQCTMSYSPPYPADTHTLTYEPGVITKVTKPNLGKGSTLSIADMTVAGQATKVLNFYTAAGAEDKLDISVTQTVENANAIRFETDLMVTPVTETLSFTLEPLNTSGKSPFTLTLTAKKNGILTLSGAGISETVIGNSGEWIHLKIEYMNPELDYTDDGKRDIIVKVYIGSSETPAVTGYKPNSVTSHYNALSLEKARLSVSKEPSGNVYLDNTMFWQLVLTPDEGGLPLKEGEDVIGDGSFDKDGWD